jgi:hypothetical protein
VNEKSLRLDLIVAVAALLFSGVAAGASAYQTYVIRKQFSATVWPYLTYITSSSADKFFELDINNPGIGPALIYSASITRDGKPIRRPVGPTISPALAQAIQPERSGAEEDEKRLRIHGVSNMTASTIAAGDVIPAGSKLELLRVEGKLLSNRVIANIPRIDITVCYCSLLGDCWTKRLSDDAVRPKPVPSCPNT